MSASRKGLKRLGLRRYIVEGPRPMVIERDRPWRWFVRPASYPNAPGGFFSQTFRRLRCARAYAEAQAGIEPYPYLDIPVCLRRWKPGART